PRAPDSVIERFGTELCVDWNGFLSDLVQILELQNTSEARIALRVRMQNFLGEVQDTLQFELSPDEQRDIVVNDLIGFTPMTYGTLCVQTISGEEDALDGQYTYYKFTEDRASFVFAFAEEFLVFRKGAQYLAYNNITPRLSEFEPIAAV